MSLKSGSIRNDQNQSTGGDMKPYWTSSDGDIYHGNVLDVMKALPDESVHMCVTSPPYWGLRDYGNDPQVWDDPGGCEHDWETIIKPPSSGSNGFETLEGGKQTQNLTATKQSHSSQFCQKCNAWRGSLGLEPTPELFIKHMVQIFAEVRRVLRSDGTLWLNIGDSYCGYKGDNYMKNPESSQLQSKSTVPKCHNIGSPRTAGGGLKPKDLVGIPWMLAFALRADGWWLRSDIIWSKPNPMPESCTDRPTKAHEYLFLLTKSANYYYDADAIREKHQDNHRPNGFKGKDGIGPRGDNQGWSTGVVSLDKHRQYNPSGRNKRTVWTIPTEPTPEAHFATFPKKLVEPCILAGTSEKGCCVECGAPWERVVERPKPPNEAYAKAKDCDDSMVRVSPLGQSGKASGSKMQKWLNENPTKTIGWEPGCDCFGENHTEIEPENKRTFHCDTEPCTVLDPFLGSGKTALVAMKHGRRFLGVELSKSYLDEIAIPKITKERKQRKLFQ